MGRLLRQERNRSLLRDAQSAEAQIITPPFDQHGAKFRDDRLQEWQIFPDELLLQSDRMRGDDNSRVLVLERVQD